MSVDQKALLPLLLLSYCKKCMVGKAWEQGNFSHALHGFTRSLPTLQWYLSKTHPHWHWQGTCYPIPEVPQLLRKCLDEGGGLGQLLIEVLHLILLWLSVIERVKRHAAKSREPLQVRWLALVEMVGKRTNWGGAMHTNQTCPAHFQRTKPLATIVVGYWPKEASDCQAPKHKYRCFIVTVKPNLWY